MIPTCAILPGGKSAIAAAIQDPFYASVAALLHGDGANGSTTFTDSSVNGATLTKTGTITISTTQSLFGGASINVSSASGNKLQFPNSSLYKASGVSWTLEMAIYCAAYSANKVLFDTDNDTSNTTGFAWYIGNDGKVRVYNGGTSTNLGGTGAALTANAWQRLALTWDGTNLRSFREGALEWTASSGFSNAWGSSQGPCLFADKAASPAQCLNGYADEFRFTKGICRQTSSYTLDTAAFPNS
jgi:hypothetical protein